MSLLPHRGKTGKVGRCTLADVARAQAEALTGDAIEMATRIYNARKAAIDHSGAVANARQEERDRCLRICRRQYPDNLMAREIARQIKSGFSLIAQ